MGLDLLRQLTPLAALSLYHEETQLAAVRLFEDITGNYSTFLDSDGYDCITEFLTTPSAKEILLKLKSGEFDDETMSFAGLLISYGDAKVYGTPLLRVSWVSYS